MNASFAYGCFASVLAAVVFHFLVPAQFQYSILVNGIGILAVLTLVVAVTARQRDLPWVGLITVVLYFAAFFANLMVGHHGVYHPSGTGAVSIALLGLAVTIYLTARTRLRP